MNETDVVYLLYQALKQLPARRWGRMAGFSCDGDNNSNELIIDSANGRSFVISSKNITRADRESD